MTKNKNYLTALALLEGIGPASVAVFEKLEPDLEKVWHNLAEFLPQTRIKKNTFDKILAQQRALALDLELEKLKEENITVVTKHCENFPRQLKEIKSAPFALFVWGNPEVLSKKQIAVVGPRKLSDYGKLVTEKIVGELSRAGMVITSGLADGIDAIAHKTVVENENQTIAVLGSGFNELKRRPAAWQLAQEIVAFDGAIISEYPPKAISNRFTFPARNRIISGLSLGTLIAEAPTKSGSLITANYALEQNREVFAIPGNIFHENSQGVHTLIQQGAKLIQSAKDILECFNFITPEKEILKKHTFTDPQEEKIFKELSFEPIHINKLCQKCNLSFPQLSAKLSMMELNGMVKNVGNGMFIRQ